MEKFNAELLEKAKQVKSAEELLALAEENGVRMTREQAEAYYAQMNPKSGELSDDELDNVAGGGCGGDSNFDAIRQYFDNFQNGERVYCSNLACPSCGCHYGTYYSERWPEYSERYIWVNCEKCGSNITQALEMGYSTSDILKA